MSVAAFQHFFNDIRARHSPGNGRKVTISRTIARDLWNKAITFEQQLKWHEYSHTKIYPATYEQVRPRLEEMLRQAGQGSAKATKKPAKANGKQRLQPGATVDEAPQGASSASAHPTLTAPHAVPATVPDRVYAPLPKRKGQNRNTSHITRTTSATATTTSVDTPSLPTHQERQPIGTSPVANGGDDVQGPSAHDVVQAATVSLSFDVEGGFEANDENVFYAHQATDLSGAEYPQQYPLENSSNFNVAQWDNTLSVAADPFFFPFPQNLYAAPHLTHFGYADPSFSYNQHLNLDFNFNFDFNNNTVPFFAQTQGQSTVSYPTATTMPAIYAPMTYPLTTSGYAEPDQAGPTLSYMGGNNVYNHLHSGIYDNISSIPTATLPLPFENPSIALGAEYNWTTHSDFITNQPYTPGDALEYPVGSVTADAPNMGPSPSAPTFAPINHLETFEGGHQTPLVEVIVSADSDSGPLNSATLAPVLAAPTTDASYLPVPKFTTATHASQADILSTFDDVDAFVAPGARRRSPRRDTLLAGFDLFTHRTSDLPREGPSTRRRSADAVNWPFPPPNPLERATEDDRTNAGRSSNSYAPPTGSTVQSEVLESEATVVAGLPSEAETLAVLASLDSVDNHWQPTAPPLQTYGPAAGSLDVQSVAVPPLTLPATFEFTFRASPTPVDTLPELADTTYTPVDEFSAGFWGDQEFEDLLEDWYEYMPLPEANPVLAL